MMLKFINLVLFTFLLSNFLKASDIIEISLVTNKIIAVHFDDGFAVYHKKGQKRSNESVIVEPLNIQQAEMLSNYSVSSSTDMAYAVSTKPLDLGRKTKGSEFTWMCQSWNNGCVNSAPDHVKEHWIYLFLPEPLQNNQEYILNTGELANNGNEWKFVFNEKMLNSPMIHTNLIGYTPNPQNKFGYLYHWMGEKGGVNLSAYLNKKFYLVDHFTEEIVFEGTIKFRKSKTNAETGQLNDTPNANFLGADVYECDFSSFQQTGKFRLVVENMGCSNPFKIQDDVYQQVFYTSIRGLYHNRSGIELKNPFTEFTRPAPHNPLITPGFAGKLKYTASRFIDWKNGDHSPEDKPAIEAGIKGSINSWGWYQDAGDWDGYFDHMKVPLVLMLSWQIAPENYIDNQLNLPESGNDIPDILDEAAWLIRYFQRTRKLIMDNGYGTGGVGARVCGDHFGSDGEGKPSYEDINRIYIISGEDPHSTYQYAGLAAHFAYCLKMLGKPDPEGIDWEKEAEEAYNWAKNNTLPGDEVKKPAMPNELKDYRAYAAASLYQVTGKAIYKQQMEIDLVWLSSGNTLEGEKLWPVFTLANFPDSLETNESLKSKAKQSIINSANEMVTTANRRACRWGGNFYFPMLVGHATTPMILEIILGYHLVKNSSPTLANSYLSVIQNTADYFLGTNPLNTTWITGLGIKQPGRVFHIDSWYNGKEEMAPGITPYGPWRNESYFTGQGIWDVAWAYKSIYPSEITTWPGHERWFGNYGTPLNAEFTIHQNTILNAAVYGFLGGPANPSFKENQKPVVNEFVLKSAGNDWLRLQTKADDPDGENTIHKVEFYNDWHKIGEAKKAPFEILFKPKPGEFLKIKAKVIDELGAYSYSDVKNESDIVTSAKMPEKKSEIKVYPNPFKNEVYFYLPESFYESFQLDIFDLTGKLIYTKNFKKGTISKNIVNWTPNKKEVPTGIYYYRIYDPGGSRQMNNTGKIVYNQ
jgi:hypothetical protein